MFYSKLNRSYLCRLNFLLTYFRYSINVVSVGLIINVRFVLFMLLFSVANGSDIINIFVLTIAVVISKGWVTSKLLTTVNVGGPRTAQCGLLSLRLVVSVGGLMSSSRVMIQA